jgi:CBS domain-containing protein
MKTGVKVGDCMTKGVVALRENASAAEAAAVMEKGNVGSIVISKNGKPVGIVTEGDIVRRIVAKGKEPKSVKLSAIMSTPVHTIEVQEDIESAARLMSTHDIHRLPVVKNDKIVGVISETDIIRISPSLYDILTEREELSILRGEEKLTGVCEVCGNYSETLKRVDAKLVCEDCEKE